MLFPNWNQICGNLTGGKIVELSLASLALAITTAISTPQVAVAQNDQIAKVSKSQQLPVVRSTALDHSINVPWSRPVQIIDPFEGNYVGIFDKHYFYKRLLNADMTVQVVSLWQRDSVRFLLGYSDRNCSLGHDFFRHHISRECLNTNTAVGLTQLWLKIGTRVFRLEGQNSQFSVNSELAVALKNAPTENISIRLLTENGETVDSQIGKSTVQAWKSIY